MVYVRAIKKSGLVRIWEGNGHFHFTGPELSWRGREVSSRLSVSEC